MCNEVYDAYGPPEVSAAGVMKPPGELISCALFALLPGVWKLDLRFTVLPLAPLAGPCRGVLGTSPSSLSRVNSTVHAEDESSRHTCRTYHHPWLLVLAGPA